MSYVEQVYFGQTINNLAAIKTLGNSAGGSFTAGTSASWATGAASGATVIFTSTTSNSNVTNLRSSVPTYSVVPTILETDGSASVNETAVATFHPLTAGQMLTMDGLTFLAGANGATAAQLATAFSNLSSGTLAASLNTTKSLADAAGGTFSTGSVSVWNTGVATSANVTFTSITASTNVTNLTSAQDVGTSLPVIIETDGTGASTETAAVTFRALAAGQALSMEGLTFTAGANGASAVQVANAFANINSGDTAAAKNLAKNLGDAAGGVFSVGSAALWNTGVTSGASVTFTSTTTNTNVSNLTSSLVIDASAPLIATTDGSAAVTETGAVTFNSLTAGDSLSVAGLTFTAGANGATAAQVANAFASIAVGTTADTANNSPMTMSSAYVVTPGVQTTATSLSGYVTSPVDGKTYTFLAAGTFTVTAAITTIAAIKGSVTGIKYFLNGALIDSISYGTGLDDSMFGVTYVANPTQAQVVAQRAQASLQFNNVLSLVDGGASFIGSSASNGGNDQAQGGAGNDTFIGYAGNDYFDGKGGVNTAIYRGAFNDYVITSGTTTDRVDPTGLNQVAAITVMDTVANRDGTDTLVNIQRLQFSDANLALDVGPTQKAGSVYMLYQATFNRTPDAAGLGYWIAQLDKGKDITSDVANFFVNSPEFQAKYGANSSNASYVDNLYQNVLHRAGDTGGIAFWNQQLDNHLMSKAAVLENFATLPEGAGLVGTAIAHGINYQPYSG